MRYGLSASNRGDYADRCAFPAQSSVLDEHAVLERIVPQYQLPSVRECVFFSRGDSDIYQLRTSESTYYLKIYRPPDSPAKGEAEGILVNALLAQGASVVPAMARHDGNYATPITASEGTRVVLVFEEAPPHSLDAADEDAYRTLGEAVARLHNAGDALDERLAGAMEEPSLLPYAERLADEQDFAELQELQDRVLEQLWPSGLSGEDDIGWCHADLALCNIRLQDNGEVVFFDFGNARILSRELELAWLRGSLRQKLDTSQADHLWSVFEQAYAGVRPFSWPKHTERWQLLWALLKIRWIGGVMASCPLRMGTETFNPKWVRTQLEGVRELLRESPS